MLTIMLFIRSILRDQQSSLGKIYLHNVTCVQQYLAEPFTSNVNIEQLTALLRLTPIRLLSTASDFTVDLRNYCGSYWRKILVRYQRVVRYQHVIFTYMIDGVALKINM